MKKELVISAFVRDYKSQFLNVSKDVQFTVYRKGEIKNLREMEIYIPNNVGRDVHTFYYHLVNRYYTLSDITFFSQDYFLDHVHNYVEIINGNIDTWNENSSQYDDGCWFFNKGICDKENRTLDCDKYGLPHHDLGEGIINIWNILFNEPCPEKISFSPGGHFAITKEAVHKVPLEVYKKVLNLLEEHNSQSPWIIERLNSYINMRLNKFKI
jgi:hypothetical protein